MPARALALTVLILASACDEFRQHGITLPDEGVVDTDAGAEADASTSPGHDTREDPPVDAAQPADVVEVLSDAAAPPPDMSPDAGADTTAPPLPDAAPPRDLRPPLDMAADITPDRAPIDAAAPDTTPDQAAPLDTSPDLLGLGASCLHPGDCASGRCEQTFRFRENDATCTSGWRDAVPACGQRAVWQDLINDPPCRFEESFKFQACVCGTSKTGP